MDKNNQAHRQQTMFDTEGLDTIDSEPVTCFGMTFEADEERREYFLEKLREKLKDPEFRKIEGFPIGEDEDILALSDPPHYTACPNPFIGDFIKHYGKPYDPSFPYSRKPFSSDVSEGKNDPIYNAHSYHTKVPHKAIMRYILHYTKPGDVIFDGFSGTGMTGVAAQLCANKTTIESLGYRVDKTGTIYQQEINEDSNPVWTKFSKLGARNAILNDLSPAANFIAYNYNTTIDVQEFEREIKHILKKVENECEWMFETFHIDGKTKGRINYTFWSDVFLCPECAGEVIFWDAAVKREDKKVNNEFPCPHCNANLTKRRMDRAWVTSFDTVINQTIHQAKKVPVLISYYVGKKRYEKRPDQVDLEHIEKVNKLNIPYWFPTDRIPKGDKTGEPLRIGITHVHHFYFKRNLWVIASFVDKLRNVSPLSIRLRNLFVKTAAERITSCLASIAFSYFFHGGGGFINAGTKGTLYISSVIPEIPAYKSLNSRLTSLKWEYYPAATKPIISTQSTTRKVCKSESVDYVFIDPPFGGNLMYSELSFLWEAWLKLFTNSKSEAIENKAQNKSLPDYQSLMAECFREYYRVLKPGRWMTVEFHNSKNIVWNCIQEALQVAGFVIADVRTLNKKQGSFNQYTAASSVKQDLIISAYKPNGGLENRFKLMAGNEDGVWDFIRTHLKQLPVFVHKSGQLEVVAERQHYLLFDRMVAFHVQRGVTVPLSAAEFYAGLEQRFPPRDGMYFLPDQAAEYDKKRMSVKEVLQLQLFVSDEASAIQWLKQLLAKKPQSFQDIHPRFLKEIGGWLKHEKPLELSELLRENFLFYDGKGEVPSQIHSYLSSNFKELRNLEKDDPALKSKAKNRWYVPDPNKAGDLEKLRERALMREFEEYRESKQRRLKVFRLEAVRAGFKKAWQERDYATIIAVARKIPEKILQEDHKLLMWYDQALTRMGDE